MEKLTIIELIIVFALGKLLSQFMIFLFHGFLTLIQMSIDPKTKMKDLRYKHTPPAPERKAKPQIDTSTYIERF